MTPEPASVVRLRGPADILTSVPHLLGFHPTESLVIICLSGPRRRQGLTMRMDLPAARYEAQMSLELATRVAHEAADEVLLICYTQAADAGEELPRAGLVDMLGELLAQHDIGVHDAYLARGTRWWSYVCRDPRCCPAAGTELPREPSAAAGMLAAEIVWQGGSTLPDRVALAASIAPAAGAGPGTLAVPAAEPAAGDLAPRGSPETAAGYLKLARTVLRRYRDGSRGLAEHEALWLRAGLRDLRVRDEMAMWGLDRDPAMLLAMLTDLARATPTPDAAPVCTLLAWVAYLDGNGALANVALERALCAEDDYSMALLLIDALAAQLTPSDMRRITASASRTPLVSTVRTQRPRRRSRSKRRGRRGGTTTER